MIHMDTAQLLTCSILFGGKGNPDDFDVEGAAGYLDEVATDKRQEVKDLSPLLIDVTLDVYRKTPTTV